MEPHCACVSYISIPPFYVEDIYMYVAANVAMSESYLPVLFIVHKHIRSHHPID